MSAPSLCSALAIADSSTFLMMPAPFFGLKARMFSAFSTRRPRIWSATRRPFCADRRVPRKTAETSIMRSLFLRLLVRDVALEGPRQRELAQLVTHHVLGHEDRHMLAPVVHRDGQADEVGQHGGTTRPRLDRALVVRAAHGFDLFKQMPVDKRAFFN